MVKDLPVVQETQVRFLGQEDPLEKGMATHSSILAWKIPWTEEPGTLTYLYQSIGSGDFLDGSVVKNPPAMQEMEKTRV